MEQHLRVGVRLRVSGQNQPATVGGGNADIDHLNRGQFFQDGRGREARSMRQQLMLQRDLQTVGQQRNSECARRHDARVDDGSGGRAGRS